MQFWVMTGDGTREVVQDLERVCVLDHCVEEAISFQKDCRCWGCGKDEDREARGFAVGAICEWSNVSIFLRLHEPIARSLLAMGPQLVSNDIKGDCFEDAGLQCHWML